MPRSCRILACAFLATVTNQALAADRPEYAFSAHATPRGEQIVIDVKVTHTKPGGGRVNGEREVVTDGSPRILLDRGRRAEVIIGTIPSQPKNSAKRDAAPTRDASVALERERERAALAATSPAGVVLNTDGEKPVVEAGYQIDVISMKGADKVLIVTSVIENGLTIWADAKTIDVDTRGK